MFTAPRNRRSRSSAGTAGATAALIAVLLLANAAVIVGLGATAHAQGFPDALPYAPMTWEKKAPNRLPELPAQSIGKAEALPAPQPVERAAIAPVRSSDVVSGDAFAEERPAPSVASVGAAGHAHRMLLIALMAGALATMAAVSGMMMRGLAREIAETERKRRRF